jgi:hypothetical protein
MDELNEELIVLSAIFGEEIDLTTNSNSMRISLPLRFGLQLRFLINVIEKKFYEIEVQVSNHVSSLQTHQNAGM